MAVSSSASAKPRPKNWLLIKIRQWHTYLGVALALFIVMVCLTGIYLNHKDWFEGLAKGKWSWPSWTAAAMADEPEHGGTKAPVLTTSTNLSLLPMTFAEAQAHAREQFGDVALEKIELKDEKGTLIYKIKTHDGRELTIEPASGRATLKDKKEDKKEKEQKHDKDPSEHKPQKDPHEPGEKARQGLLTPLPSGGSAEGGSGSALAAGLAPVKASDAPPIKVYTLKKSGYRHDDGSLNWGKIIKDAHTGKLFGGTAGRLLIDFTSLVIIVLTVSGVYLWAVPILRKRKAAREAAAVKTQASTTMPAIARPAGSA